MGITFFETLEAHNSLTVRQKQFYVGIQLESSNKV